MQPRQPIDQKRQLSRREFMTMMGVAIGSGLAVVCGATTVGAYWLLTHDKSSTDRPVPEATQLALSKTVERPPIVSRAEWGARAVNHAAEEEFGFYTLDNPEGWREYEDDLRDAYQTVVIHHSALYETDDLTSILAIQDLHLDDRGWADIGYHFCVGQDGTVYEGRRMSVRGVHTEGYNTGSLGVCLLGNFQVITPTGPQLTNTHLLVNWLALRLRLTHLAGHREFNDITVCPGANLYPYLDEMASQALLLRGIDGYLPPPEQQLTPTSYGTCC